MDLRKYRVFAPQCYFDACCGLWVLGPYEFEDFDRATWRCREAMDMTAMEAEAFLLYLLYGREDPLKRYKRQMHDALSRKHPFKPATPRFAREDHDNTYRLLSRV